MNNEEILEKICVQGLKVRHLTSLMQPTQKAARLINGIIRDKMREKYFYDVSVYRLSRERYYQDMNKYINKHMHSGSPSHIKMIEDSYTKEPTQKRASEDRLRKSYGGAWEYNEIIGYIRLYFFGTQIRGEYWGVNSKRVVRTRNKIFEYKTWKLASEMDLHREPDSLSIFSKILKYLKKCQKELKGRYIDTRNFKAIGFYVDWKSLYEESKNV